ncbi:sensor histidine kinase [Clostridium sp. C105KSO13]|uniref:sensor histidine kinase n=1 Tax=Clostridium sp. C105KSO13 TaxID=1776045 RepID=UPI000740613A|nr:sensor histidine kinase [Clostridium sp. C105KSO13]CUX29785.1 Sensor histidine kinase YpdA [Clostridium sp. C105KSO13]
MGNKREKSMSTRIFLGMFLLFFFILLIFSIIISALYGKRMEAMEINYHLEATNGTKEQFNMLTSMIDAYSYSVVVNEVVQDVLKNGGEGRNIEEIQTYINDMVRMNDSINHVHILGINDFWCSTNMQDNRRFYRQFLKEYVEGTERKGIWTGFHNTEEDDYLSSTSYIRPVFDSETKEVYGIVVLDVSYESIHKLFTASSIRLKDKAVIVNSDGAILLQYPLLSDYTQALRRYPEVLKKSTQIEGKLYKKDVIIVSEKINLADWSLVRFLQKDAATESIREMLRVFQIVLVITTMISICYTIWLTRSITHPIKELMQVCKKVMEGDFTAHASVKRQDEFGRLGGAFNSMIDQINDFFDKERQSRNRKAEMEYQILQAQINPHFLYNTLDSIKWLAVMQGVDNIAEMSTALITLLQYNLGKVEGETTLHNEIESVRNYIIIQKYRYTDIFEFTTMIDEETEKCRVPRFILQPLVENSIIHGFNGKRGNYRVHIAAIIFDGKLHIRVIDNGMGMDAGSTEKINKGQEKSTRFSNIGISNIRERIKLYFGEGAELIFDSEPNVATIAEIILPVIKEEL